MSEYILKCTGLTKMYSGMPALLNVNLELEKGKIIGLLGPNGSGKTTLIKLANGLLTPNGGELLIDGKNVGIETKKIVSYLPDKTYLDESMKVKELLHMFADFYDDFSMENATEMIEKLGIDIESKLKTLSKGNKEKVQLILVMSRRARLYLLDEPIGGVDPATREYILDSIIKNYNEDATVVISTHLISDVENVLDEVIFIRYGEIILHDSVDNIREKEGKSVDEYFKEVFRC